MANSQCAECLMCTAWGTQHTLHSLLDSQLSSEIWQLEMLAESPRLLIGFNDWDNGPVKLTGSDE